MNAIENTNVRKWIGTIEKATASASRSKKLGYLLRLSSKPRRSRVSVNLNKLEKFANENDKIIVPGKVLGSGEIRKKISIAAIDFSAGAIEKLDGARCKVVKLDELLNDKTARIII